MQRSDQGKQTINIRPPSKWEIMTGHRPPRNLHEMIAQAQRAGDVLLECHLLAWLSLWGGVDSGEDDSE